MKTRRLFSLLLVLCLMLAIAPVSASAAIVASGSCGSNAKYSLDREGTMQISGHGEIWSFQNNYGFTGAPWEHLRGDIKKIVINNGITAIGSSAFLNCQNLTSVSIANSVTSIGRDAFYGCRALTDIKFPSKLDYIGAYAFYRTALTDVVLPDKVTTIGEHAFADSTITSIVIPAEVSTASESLFDGSERLTSVTFKGPITDIGERAFYSCHALTDIHFEGGLSGTINDSAFAYCRSLKSFDIPTGVIKILNRAFDGCTSLSSITIPNSVETIFDSAFAQTALVSLTIPASVDYLGWGAFSCDSLESVTMYTSAVEGINKYFGCKPKSIHIIGDTPQTDVKVFGTQNDRPVIYYDEGTSGWNPPTWNGYPIKAWGQETVTEHGILGDANGDGSIDNVDAMLVLQYAVSLHDGIGLILPLCDVNSDSAVNNVDAMQILQFSVDLIPEFAPAA